MPEVFQKKYLVFVRFLRSYWMTVIVLLIILGVCIYPFSPDSNLPKFKYSDKLIHLMMYVSLAFIFYYEFQKDKQIKFSYRSFYIVLLLPVLFGGVIEILQQSFFPPRTAEWLDWISDIVGTLIGFLVAKMIFKDRK